MTIENTSVVDFIAHDNDSPIVRLVIADHLDWTDEPTHLYTLQEKLNRYLAFVEGGELTERFPNLSKKKVLIDVAFLCEPTNHAREHFLEKVQQVIRSAGMDFTWRVGHAS